MARIPRSIASTRAALAAYTTIPSQFSNNTIRVKSWGADEALCNGGAPHHAGWADIGDRHLFYWFHEARHQQKDAPLLIWLQGGPGGSSLHGMLFQNGPCLVEGPYSTRYNPFSWTESFNVVYLDQPAGAGFSYVDDSGNKSAHHSRTEKSSLDIVAFIKLFYEAFPHLSTLDLHIAGSSYGGRFIPALGSTILEYNRFIPTKRDRIPLRSLMIGNGWTNPTYQIPAMYDVSCYDYRGYIPHIDPPLCSKILPHVNTCEILLRGCETSKDPVLCLQAMPVCSDKVSTPIENVTRSIYDRRRRECSSPGNCYPEIENVVDFLNSQELLETYLEIFTESGGRKSNWTLQSSVIMDNYLQSGDCYTPTTTELRNVLQYARTASKKGEAPVDVLYYVGVTDIACNAEGVLALLVNLWWDGRTEFRAMPWKELSWKAASGGRGGRAKRVQNLWLVEIEEAGHVVPTDQPESSLAMVKEWLQYTTSRALPEEEIFARKGNEDSFLAQDEL